MGLCVECVRRWLTAVQLPSSSDECGLATAAASNTAVFTTTDPAGLLHKRPTAGADSGSSCCCSPEDPFYALFNHVWVACGDDLLLLSGRTLQCGLAAHKPPNSGGCDEFTLSLPQALICHTYRSTVIGRVASYSSAPNDRCRYNREFRNPQGGLAPT